MLYVWRSTTSITGFEAWWTVPNDYTGYEPIVQMFGSPVPAIYFKRKYFNEYEVLQVEALFDEEQPRRITFMTDDPT